MRFENIIVDLLPLNVSITHSPAKALKAGFEVGDNDAVTCRVGERKYLVYVNPNNDTTLIQGSGLLAHEAVHVMQGYFDDIGEDEPGCEMQAYIVQAVVQWLLQEHFERNGKKAKGKQWTN